MQPLLEWMRSPALDQLEQSNLLYKKGAVEQMIFFRDQIAPCFLFQYDAKSDDAYEAYLAFTLIAGWHTSKSINLPVYHCKRPGLQVYARDNFYNWNVTLISEISLDFPEYFKINNLDGYLFMEGMSAVKRPVYHSGAKEFSFAINSRLDLYAVMKYVGSCFPEYTYADYVTRFGQPTFLKAQPCEPKTTVS